VAVKDLEGRTDPDRRKSLGVVEARFVDVEGRVMIVSPPSYCPTCAVTIAAARSPPSPEIAVKLKERLERTENTGKKKYDLGIENRYEVRGGHVKVTLARGDGILAKKSQRLLYGLWHCQGRDSGKSRARGPRRISSRTTATYAPSSTAGWKSPWTLQGILFYTGSPRWARRSRSPPSVASCMAVTPPASMATMASFTTVICQQRSLALCTRSEGTFLKSSSFLRVARIPVASVAGPLVMMMSSARPGSKKWLYGSLP
jgi:hypothetical protein